MRRGAMALTPPPWGAEVSIGYERFVQPVLDKYCGKCHQGDGDARAKLDLTFRDSSLKDPVYPELEPQLEELLPARFFPTPEEVEAFCRRYPQLAGRLDPVRNAPDARQQGRQLEKLQSVCRPYSGNLGDICRSRRL